MSEKKYDAIIIGGGHNGLICASILSKKNKKVLIAVQDTSYVAQFKLINHISKIDVIFEVKSGHNIKKFFTYADKNEFDYILLVGDQEFHNSSIVLKNLKSKEQKILLIKDLDLSNAIR